MGARRGLISVAHAARFATSIRPPSLRSALRVRGYHIATDLSQGAVVAVAPFADDGSPWCCTGHELAGMQHYRPIHDHVADSLGILGRVEVCGAVNHVFSVGVGYVALETDVVVR